MTGIKTSLIFLLLFSTNLVRAQVMSGKDSVLVRTYWNKIDVKATGSKNNQLYNGIDNMLTLHFPDTITSKLHVFLSVNNGKILKSEDHYLTIPKNAGRSFITLYYTSENGDTIMIGKKQLIVNSVPIPSLIIGKNMITENTTVDRRVFFTGDSLKLYYTDDYPESSNWFEIKNFMIGYSYGGIYISADNNGSVLTPKTIEFIKKLAPGQEVVIKVNSITPSQISTYLPLVRFHLK